MKYWFKSQNLELCPRKNKNRSDWNCKTGKGEMENFYLHCDPKFGEPDSDSPCDQLQDPDPHWDHLQDPDPHWDPKYCCQHRPIKQKKSRLFVDSSEKCLLLFQWSCAGPQRCAATPERQSSAARLLIRSTWTHECPRGRRYVNYKVLIRIGQTCRIRCFVMGTLVLWIRIQLGLSIPIRVSKSGLQKKEANTSLWKAEGVIIIWKSSKLSC